MRTMLCFVVAVCLAALLFNDASGAGISAPGDAVNKTCPISGRPIDGTNFVTVGEHKVGLCCGGCPARFEGWNEAKKAEYLTSLGALAGEPPATAAPGDEKKLSDPYTLATCPVSGLALGAAGDAVVKKYEGREVRFCCNGCVGKFEADTKTYFKKIDEKMIKQQLAYYPLDVCPMMDEPLVEDGVDIAENVVYNNRLVRFCCKGCVRKFKKDPTRLIKQLDDAIVKQQRKDYPLTTCVVGGGKLGSMGEPVELIAGNRLVRFCCKGCTGAFKKDPARYLTVIDKAWKARGFPGPAAGRGSE